MLTKYGCKVCELAALLLLWVLCVRLWMEGTVTFHFYITVARGHCSKDWQMPLFKSSCKIVSTSRDLPRIKYKVTNKQTINVWFKWRYLSPPLKKILLTVEKDDTTKDWLVQ